MPNHPLIPVEGGTYHFDSAPPEYVTSTMQDIWSRTPDDTRALVMRVRELELNSHELLRSDDLESEASEGAQVLGRWLLASPSPASSVIEIRMARGQAADKVDGLRPLARATLDFLCAHPGGMVRIGDAQYWLDAPEKGPCSPIIFWAADEDGVCSGHTIWWPFVEIFFAFGDDTPVYGCRPDGGHATQLAVPLVMGG
jgi:hypothetical protein